VTYHAYPSSKITVPEKFVAPPKKIQAQIDAEVAIKQKVFKSSPPERLWQGPFVSPANTRYTSSFGSRRVYNGQTRSVATQPSPFEIDRSDRASSPYAGGGF